MKKYLLILNLCILGLLISASALGAIQINKNFINQNIESENIKSEPYDFEMKMLNIKPMVYPKDISPLFLNNGNIQVTFSEDNDASPFIGIDYTGNPCILYHNQLDLFQSDIYFQRSMDGGESWPDDYFISWGLESPGINPEICFYEDGHSAVGTHDSVLEEPSLYLHHYYDIDDPSTWGMGGWDKTTSSYVKETTITTNGNDITAVATINDYSNENGEYPQTVSINWNADPEDTSYPGVIWLIKDDLCTQLSAASGEKVFFSFQREDLNGRKKVYVSYCEIDIETVYSDWKLNQVAGSAFGNCSNPHIDVSGDTAFIVYVDDKYGSKDIYCATSSSGSFWKKYVVANTEDDEDYPVVTANGDNVNCLFVKNGDLYSSQSEDAGETWSEPIKINDADNSVVGGFDSINIDGPFAAWTDDRNENQDIYFSSVGAIPILTAEFTSSGLGFGISISNIGNGPALEVPWSIDFDGLVFLGAHTEGIIQSIEPGETITLSTGFIFGFGPITITVVVDDITLTASAFLLGPLILNFTIE